MVKILSPRWQAAVRYLGWAEPFWRWRLSYAICPNCNGKLFVSLASNPFMIRCLSCRCNATSLAIISVLRSHVEKYKVNVAWEMSTYGAAYQYLSNNIQIVIGSEYYPNIKSGDFIGGVLNQDVQNLSFDSDSLDLITSNQVFEHVPDDISGYSECYRVLRNNGALVFTVPLYDIPSTECIAGTVANEVIFHNEPEYHDSRTSGLKSVVTFWHHSVHDICNRVSQVGFNAYLVDVMITKVQNTPAKVIYAVKN